MNLKQRSSALFSAVDNNGHFGLVFLGVSVLLHGLFFGGLIFFQNFSLSRPMPPVIQIDLVSFSSEPAVDDPDNMPNKPVKGEAPALETETAAPQPDAPLPVAPAVVQPPEVPTVKPDISLKTKPKNLKDLLEKAAEKEKEPEKKEEPPAKPPDPPKQPAPEKVAAESKKNLENQAETAEKNRISEALSRLQRKVTEQGKAREGGGQGQNPGAGGKGFKPIDLYKMVLGSAIEQNWVFNDVLLSKIDQNLEVRILIKILKSGEIRDIIYETKSESNYLNESAKKAIKKSNPLPPLPAGMHSYDVVVIFTPKGLK